MACINKWDETSELLWLDVQLIRKACKVWNRLSEESKGNYCSTKTDLRKYFKPDSHRDLYVADFHIPKKKRDESWDDLAGNLQTLTELVLLDLEEYGKDRLSLERLLNHKDPILVSVYNYVMEGWPNKPEEKSIKPFYQRKDQLSTDQGIRPITL